MVTSDRTIIVSPFCADICWGKTSLLFLLRSVIAVTYTDGLLKRNTWVTTYLYLVFLFTYHFYCMLKTKISS